MQQYVDAYLNTFITARNGLFVGFPFLCVGTFLGTLIDRAIRKELKWLVLGLYIVEVLVAQNIESTDDKALYFMSAPMAAVLLLQLL